MIKLKSKELEEICKQKEGGVSLHHFRGPVTVPPSALHHINKYLTSQLDSSIGKQHPFLDGIVLGYRNVQVMGDLGIIRNDTSEVTYDVLMDVYLFQPKIGDILMGVINKKSDTHLSVLVHKMFNVVIPKPSDMTQSEVWFGNELHVGQRVTFQIMVLDLYGVLPYIRGALQESNFPSVIHEVDVGVVDFSKVNKPSNNDEVDNSFKEFARKYEKTENTSTPKLPKTKQNGLKNNHNSESTLKTKKKDSSSDSDNDSDSNCDDTQRSDLIKSILQKNVTKTPLATQSTDSSSEDELDNTQRSDLIKSILLKSKQSLTPKTDTLKKKKKSPDKVLSSSDSSSDEEVDKSKLIKLLLNKSKETRDESSDSSKKNYKKRKTSDKQDLMKRLLDRSKKSFDSDSSSKVVDSGNEDKSKSRKRKHDSQDSISSEEVKPKRKRK